MFKSKLLWRMAVIILVVAFSAATIVSCGGDTPTQSTSLSTSSGGGTTGGGTGSGDGTTGGGTGSGDGTTGGGTGSGGGTTGGGTGSGGGTTGGGTGTGGNTGGGTTTKPTFPENSYYTIYAPFVNWEDKSEVPAENRIRVSWQDTNTVSEVWKKQIEGGKDNNGKRFIIRDANNNQREPLTGSYYFFDKNFNIVYYRQGKGSLLVRKFVMGIIVNYTKSIGVVKPDGQNWGIGGVYQTVLSKKEITDNNFDQLNIFMGHEHMGVTSGNLEVLILNTGYRFDNNTEFGVTFIYGDNVKTIYRESTPIKGVRNLSWKPEYVNYKFVSVDPYLWHLEDHSSQKGWKRE